MNAALEAAAYQARFSWVVSVLGAVATAAVIWLGVWLIFRDPIGCYGDRSCRLHTSNYIEDMFKPTKKLICRVEHFWQAVRQP